MLGWAERAAAARPKAAVTLPICACANLQPCNHRRAAFHENFRSRTKYHRLKFVQLCILVSARLQFTWVRLAARLTSPCEESSRKNLVHSAGNTHKCAQRPHSYTMWAGCSDAVTKVRAHACRRAYTGAHMGWEGENVKGGGGERETTAAKRKRKRKWRLVRMSKWGRPAQKSRSQNRNNTSAWSDKTRSKQLDYHCQKGKDQTLEAFFLIVCFFLLNFLRKKKEKALPRVALTGCLASSSDKLSSLAAFCLECH